MVNMNKRNLILYPLIILCLFVLPTKLFNYSSKEISKENNDEIFDIIDEEKKLHLAEYVITEQLGQYNKGGMVANAVFIVNDTAFIAAWDKGLVILDISNKSNPYHLGNYSDNSGAFDSHAYDLYVDGNYAYMVDLGDGFEIIDIHDKSNPTEVSQLYDDQFIFDVSINGNYAYLACGTSLRIIDISTPSSPSQVLEYSNCVPRGVFHDGTYLYLANAYGSGYPELQVMNVQNPLFPIMVGSFYDGEFCNAEDVFVSGNFAI